MSVVDTQVIPKDPKVNKIIKLDINPTYLKLSVR